MTYKNLPAIQIDDSTPIVVSGAVTATTTQPTRATASISAALATDAIMNNLTALTPKFAFGTYAASTTNGALVAIVAAKKIRVLWSKVIVDASGPTTVTFRSKPAGAGTDLTPADPCAANGGYVSAFSPVGIFETVAGEALTVSTGTGGSTTVSIVYVEV